MMTSHSPCDDRPPSRHKSVDSRRSQPCRLTVCHRCFGFFSTVVRVEVEEERSVGFNSAVSRSTIAFSQRRNGRDAVLKAARRFDVLRLIRRPRHGRLPTGSVHSVSIQSTIDSNGRIAGNESIWSGRRTSKRYVTDRSPIYHSNAV